MSIDVTIVSGDQAPPPDVSRVGLLLGPAVVGQTGVGSVYVFDPGADVAASVGAGKSAEAVLYHLRNGRKRCVYAPAASSAGTTSAVTHVGSSGPTVTVTAGAAPTDDLTIKARVSKGGALGVGTIAVSLDGGTEAYSYTIPQENPGVIVGSIDLSSAVITSLDTTTLKFSAPAALTVTFDAPATLAAVAAQVNAAAVGGGVAISASIKQDPSTGHNYLRVQTTTVGASATVTIDDTGSADQLVGLTGASNTGSAATLAFPSTGISFTFPSGTYVLAETYTVTTTAPFSSIAQLMAAADNAYNAIAITGQKFGFVEILQAPDTAANAKALEAACESKRASWQALPAAIFPYFIVPTCLGSTGTAGVNANDLAVAQQFASSAASYSAVVHGDLYLQGTKTLGSFRRTGAVAVGMLRALYPLSEDPGFGARGGIPEASLLGPDGSTRARTENGALVTTKLGGSDGPGFTTFSLKQNTARVTHGVTRAGQASRYVHVGVLSAALRLATALYDALQAQENGTHDLDPNGRLTDPARIAIEKALTADAEDAVVNTPNHHASKAIATLDASEIMANTDHFSATATMQMLGQSESISLTVSTVGVLSLAP